MKGRWLYEGVTMEIWEIKSHAPAPRPFAADPRSTGATDNRRCCQHRKIPRHRRQASREEPAAPQVRDLSFEHQGYHLVHMMSRLPSQFCRGLSRVDFVARDVGRPD